MSKKNCTKKRMKEITRNREGKGRSGFMLIVDEMQGIQETFSDEIKNLIFLDDSNSHNIKLPRIVAAAVNVNGVICSMLIPNRHHTIVHTLAKAGIEKADRYNSGFLLDDGTYVDGKVAAQLAKQNGQLIKPLIAPPNLYSEDLW